jgi:hypothetical protein
MIRYLAVLAVLTANLLFMSSASAHCDTMKGPVVAAARQALDAGNVNVVRRRDPARA